MILFWLAGILFTFGLCASYEKARLSDDILEAVFIVLLWPAVLGAELRRKLNERKS